MESRPFRSTGAPQVQFGYNNLGLIEREAYFDADDRPIRSREGYAILLRDHYNSGHVKEERVYDEYEQPGFDADGVFGTRYTYDRRGNHTEVAEFDHDGQPTTNRFGWSRMVSVYEADREISKRFYGADGELVAMSSGAAGFDAVYENGTLSKKTFVGEDGKAVAVTGCYVKVHSTYDPRGNQTEQALFDANSNPVMHTNGWHRCSSTFDARNFEVERRYLDAAGDSAWHRDGYTTVRKRFDDLGNATAEEYLDDQGNLTIARSGYARVTRSYDSRGFLQDEKYYDDQGNAALQGLGIARVTLENNYRGLPTKMTWFDANGKRTAGPFGVESVEMVYDIRGNRTEVVWLDALDNPTELSGICRTVREFDDRGYVVEERQYDASGNRALRDGYFRVSHAVDPWGNQIETRFYDTDNNSVAHVQGHARITREFDRRGNVVVESFYDRENNLMISDQGFATRKVEYDIQNNTTSEAYFGTEGEPILGIEGFHRVRHRFERGVVVETWFLGKQLQPTARQDGSARIVRTYDDRLNLSQEMWFDVDGNPCEQDGYVSKRTEFDERGNPVRIEYFDATNRPTLNSQSYSIESFAYDALGRPISSAVFGVDADPVVRDPGKYWRHEYKYNAQGEVAYACYFGIDGKPILTSEGYAEVVHRYDQRGAWVGSLYYDDKGNQLAVQVIVQSVDPNSTAAELDIRAGDGDRPFCRTADLNRGGAHEISPRIDGQRTRLAGQS